MSENFPAIAIFSGDCDDIKVIEPTPTPEQQPTSEPEQQPTPTPEPEQQPTQEQQPTPTPEPAEIIDSKKNFYTKSEKCRMFQEQIQKLQLAFKQLDENTMSVVKTLIESVAFMSVELKDLEGVISVNGQIETYRNGAYQTGYKKSAASEAYNSMKKTYLADIKLLADLIGANAKDFNDELMDFIQRKK